MNLRNLDLKFIRKKIYFFVFVLFIILVTNLVFFSPINSKNKDDNGNIDLVASEEYDQRIIQKEGIKNENSFSDSKQCANKIIHPDDPKNINKIGKKLGIDNLDELKYLISNCEDQEKVINTQEYTFGIFRVFLKYIIAANEHKESIKSDYVAKAINLKEKILSFNNDFYKERFLRHINASNYLLKTLGMTIQDKISILESLKTYEYFNAGEIEFRWIYSNTLYENYTSGNLENIKSNIWPEDLNSKKFIKAYTKCSNLKTNSNLSKIKNFQNILINECSLWLGKIYEKGLGTYQDISKAKKYYNKSNLPQAFDRLIRLEINSPNVNYQKIEKKLLGKKEKYEDGSDYEQISLIYNLLSRLYFEKEYDSRRNNYKKSFDYLQKAINYFPSETLYSKNKFGYPYYLKNSNNQIYLSILTFNPKIDQNFNGLGENKKIEYIENLIKDFDKENFGNFFRLLHQSTDENILFFISKACVNIFEENSNCLNRLALSYGNGFGVPRDISLSLKYYSKAFSLGDTFAANNLGYNYANGGLDKIDYKKAKIYFQKSIEFDTQKLNYLVHQNLADLYLHGKGVEKNISKANELLIEASNRNNLTSNLRLGDIHYYGLLGEKNCRKAIEYYNKTAFADSNLIKKWQASVYDTYAVDEAKQKIKMLENDQSCSSDNFMEGKNYALMIGLEDYKFLPKLKTPINDIKLISQTLEDKFNYEIITINNETRVNILKQLEKLAKKLSYNDNLMIYYAGHGQYDSEIDESWWIPIDGELDSDINYISTNNIKKKLRKIKSNKILLVSDSCFSGGIFRGVKVSSKNLKKEIKNSDTRKTRLAITSGGLEPVLDTTGELNNSIFAYSFFQALDEKNNIDSADLFNIIKQKSEKYFKKLNINQKPEYAPLPVAGHIGGDYYFTTK